MERAGEAAAPVAALTGALTPWPVGHFSVVERLERQLREDKIPHAQLFTGPRGVGKRLFARAFARRLLDPEGRGGISDLIELAPEGRVGHYPVAQLEEVRRQAQLTALRGNWKVYILDDVERMSPAAAHSLLKILEEPPAGTLFLLVSGRAQLLLPTIISRCHVVQFDPLAEEAIAALLRDQGVSQEMASSMARRARGSMERAQRLQVQQQDPVGRQILEWLPQLHRIAASRLSSVLGKMDPDRTRQESEPLELRLLFEDQTQLLLEWARDGELVRQGLYSQLCFPEQLASLQMQIQQGLASLRVMERAVGQAQLAMERSVKPSVLLTGLLLRLRAREGVAELLTSRW